MRTGTRCTSTYSTTHKSCPQLHSAQHSTPLTAAATTAAVHQALATTSAATQPGGFPVYSLVLTDSHAASNNSRCLMLWLCAVGNTVTPTCRRFLGQAAGPACRCTGAQWPAAGKSECSAISTHGKAAVGYHLLHVGMSEGVLQQHAQRRGVCQHPRLMCVRCCAVASCLAAATTTAAQRRLLARLSWWWAHQTQVRQSWAHVELQTGTAFTNPFTRHAHHTPHTTTSSAVRAGLLASCWAAGLTGLLYYSMLL